MSRYPLDTNILAFLASGDEDRISPETSLIIKDLGNRLYTSSIAMLELSQLYRLNKIRTKYKTVNMMFADLEENFYIEILPFSKQHLSIMLQLEIKEGHNDPFDHAIISQAIAEKMALISSDRQFVNYTLQNLNFVFNKR